MSFLNSIKNQSKNHKFPFDHWEYNNALTPGAIEEVIKADIPDISKHNLLSPPIVQRIRQKHSFSTFMLQLPANQRISRFL